MDSTHTWPVPTGPHVPAASLMVGSVIAGRFTLEALVGRGGMGTVYRATDGLSGQRVALKLLHPGSSSDSPRRFTREAELLSSLRHPGIVSYIAHGISEQGRPFLVMEWLEGEDLAQRLARQPLSLAETLSLLRQVTQALVVAHQHGIIHRDIKPSNLFLRGGRPEQVLLLDFGLARHVMPSSAMTVGKMLLGTPGYMAPEQASSQSQLTLGADIFSLGCVLYECLTGQPPFRAPHMMAALAKILFTEPVPPRQLRPELPVALQELLERMLVKDPSRRLPEAMALRSALEQVLSQLETGAGAAAPMGTPLPSLAGVGRQLVTVLMAAPRTPTEQDSAELPSRQSLRDSLHTLLAPQGARVELLANGALVLTLVASLGSATDPANLAARCALSLVERWPEAIVVLTTGLGTLDSHLPVGEAMDRAGQLLRQVEPGPTEASTPVLLDEVTAGLLRPGFRLTRAPSGHMLLHGGQLGSDESRPLLGKPTPCVGREHELALLDMTFGRCVEESTAQAVLMTAPAGVGKSRLRHEFLRRLEHHVPAPLVLLGQGDPMSAGSADGLLGQALRRLCGISGGEPLEERRARFSRRLSLHLPAAQAREVVEFLGELCSLPFPDEHNPRLHAARADPRLMSIHMGRALVAFLKAECAHHPVLLVLEDLHWGDLLSVRLMDEALRELSEQPFLVLALARPELEQLIPGPWTQRLQFVPLRGLSRKAGTRLVREVLGADVPGALVDKLVEQAAGNALFLEELIRGLAEGGGEGTPETVLAMLQARLGRLDPGARQVLLAASFFGRTFWSGGVRALLGGDATAEELRDWLRYLREQEWIQPRSASCFPGEEEYCFRHALVRDAVYGLIPDGQKPPGHQRVGAWLEQAGESDPRVLAEHATLGEQPERAARFHAEAAERLYARHDMPGTLRSVEAALACAAERPVRVRLLALRAMAIAWVEGFAKMFDLGLPVLPELTPGDAMWCKLMGLLICGGGLLGRHEEMSRLGELLLRTTPEPGVKAAYVEALAQQCCAVAWVGAREQATLLLERMAEVGTQELEREPVTRGWLDLARNFVHYALEGRFWRAYVAAQQSTSAFLEAGSESGSHTPRSLGGQALAALGDLPGAEEQLRACLSSAREERQSLSLSVVRTHLAMTLSHGPTPGHWEEAEALAREEIADVSPLLHAGWARVALARVAAHRGQWAEAQAQARGACEVLAPYPPYRLFARTLLATALLAQGHTAEAREQALLGARELESLGGEGAASIDVHLALAEVCLSEGDSQQGEAALRRAVRCVLECARDIPDEAARERFLGLVPGNARVLELARQRWGGTV